MMRGGAYGENGKWTMDEPAAGGRAVSVRVRVRVRKSQSQSKCKRHKNAKKHKLFACGLLVLVAADIRYGQYKRLFFFLKILKATLDAARFSSRAQ